MNPLLSEEAALLKADILARYRTVHVFCRQHAANLTRSTVYQVLAGRYPGDTVRQIERIRAVLTGDCPERSVSAAKLAAELADVLQACQCAHCRRQDRRGCRGCRTQTGREVQAIENYLKNVHY